MTKLDPIIHRGGSVPAMPQSEIDTYNHTDVAPGRKYWIDGTLIVQGRVVSDIDSLEVALPKELSFWNPQQIAAWWSRSARNVGALFVEDRTEGWSACFPDPLGGAIAFYTVVGSHRFASTKLECLVKKCHEAGQPLAKDPLFQAERILFGNGGLTPSSYQNVKSLEPFQYIVINDQMTIIDDYPVFNDYLDLSINDLFQILRSDVLSAVNGSLDSNYTQKISHLTGGFDSRLVLSAADKLGRIDDLLFFCSGPEGTTDRKIADGLTHTFKLQRVSGAGLTPSKSDSMSEKLLGPLFASFGLTSSGPLGRELPVSVVAMGGGYGEVLRTFYGNRPISSDGKTLDAKLIASSFFPSTTGVSSSLTGKTTSALNTQLLSRLEYLHSRYQNIDFVGDSLYTHGRNRYHIGQNSLLWSRIGARIDPLYSVAGFVLASKITQNSRNANLLGFDLMASFNETMLALPFDKDRFNDDLQTIRRRPSEKNFTLGGKNIEFQDALSPDSRSDSPFLQILSKLEVASPVVNTSQRRTIVEEANKLGVNYWQLLNKTSGQELLRAAYEESKSSLVFEFFNEEYVRGLFTKSSLKRQELRDLYNIGGAITWLSFG